MDAWELAGILGKVLKMGFEQILLSCKSLGPADFWPKAKLEI